MPDKFNEYDPLDIELKQLFERNKEWAAQMVEDESCLFFTSGNTTVAKIFLDRLFRQSCSFDPDYQSAAG